jgi:ubiquinone/menaquinone biosynthesis C-methylase UbiE
VSTSDPTAPPPDTMRGRLLETQGAFDSVAADYDGARGNNDLIQDMRAQMWQWLDATFTPGDRVIDLGCGTGLDAVRMAQSGYRVTATDWSPQMVARTRDRAGRAKLTDRILTVTVGAHELSRLEGIGLYQGAYSNLGPLNCVPDLRVVSRECARLLEPAGKLVFTVIGRLCPWEIVHYGRQGRWSRVKVRFARSLMPVSMSKRTIWTRYYGPREFYHAFQREFELTHYRGLCVFAPPPYLTGVRDKHPQLYEKLWRLDRRVAGWPLIREMGDHFLIVMKKR